MGRFPRDPSLACTTHTIPCPDFCLARKLQEEDMTDKKSTLWATAYHEAGHAVAAMAYGKGIRRQGATIVPDPKRGAAGTVYMLKHIPGDPSVGGAYRGDSLTGRMRLRIEEDIIVSLAGPVAQRCFVHRASEATMVGAITKPPLTCLPISWGTSANSKLIGVCSWSGRRILCGSLSAGCKFRPSQRL
jgi:hypothetical protein